jgi:hypothetical protein
MNTQRTTVTPIAMSDADRVRVVLLALMSLTTAVGAAISSDLLGRVGFVLAAIALGAAAIWTPWQRRHGIAPTPPAAPTTTVAQRRAGNVTLAAFVALIALVTITVEHPDLILFAILMIAVPVASAVERLWPKGHEG